MGANIERLLLLEDDEKWYSQAGAYMVESPANLFRGHVVPNDVWSYEELHRIDHTLSLFETRFSQKLIEGLTP